MIPTHHITRAQTRIARIESLATGYRPPIVKPARPQPPRRAWIYLVIAIVLIVAFAAAVGLAAGLMIRNH